MSTRKGKVKGSLLLNTTTGSDGLVKKALIVEVWLHTTELLASMICIYILYIYVYIYIYISTLHHLYVSKKCIYYPLTKSSSNFVTWSTLLLYTIPGPRHRLHISTSSSYFSQDWLLLWKTIPLWNAFITISGPYLQCAFVTKLFPYIILQVYVHTI